MKLRLVDLIGLLCVLSLGVLAAWLYPDLPDRVPIHWGGGGTADGFAAKPVGTALNVSLPLIAYLALRFFPLISPSGFRMTRSRRVVDILNVTLVLVLTGIGATALLTAAGNFVQMRDIAPFAIGVIFVVLGNYMGKLEPNWIIGIRTPWTLASEEVWYGTHRVCRWVFLLSGLVLMAAPLLPVPPVATLLAVVFAVVIVSVGYSFALYVKLNGLSGR